MSALDLPQLRDTLDSLREGVQVLSPEWRYLYVNEAAARHGRKRREELLGRTMLECYPGIERTPVFAALEACMRERRAETLENEFQYDSGLRADFELRIQPVEAGLVVLSLDITERKRLESILRQSEKLRALGQMAASVSHDLKNILNPIALETQILRRRHCAGDADALAVLARIDDAVRTGAETVENLRRFSRHEPEQPPAPTDLNLVADTAIDICLPQLRDRTQIEVRRERGATPPVLVRASELATSIVNLVVNALDAMPDRGTITIRTEAGHGGASVEIIDTGPGMPSELQAHLFEPFFTTKPNGTGLGLAMAYAFVRRHGGRITVDTAPGRGTAVRMWFSAGLDVPAAAAAVRPAPRRVLVVDDEALSRSALATLLREDGYVVEVAAGGEEALSTLSSFDAEVLISDLRMPGMDGLTLIRRARATRTQLAVIVVSGLGEQDEAVAALLREPRTDHVPKPVEIDRLTHAVDRVLATPPD